LLAANGANVLRLIRVAIGPLPLGELAKGAWRMLTVEEVAALAAPSESSIAKPGIQTAAS